MKRKQNLYINNENFHLIRMLSISYYFRSFSPKYRNVYEIEIKIMLYEKNCIEREKKVCETPKK